MEALKMKDANYVGRPVRKMVPADLHRDGWGTLPTVRPVPGPLVVTSPTIHDPAGHPAPARTAALVGDRGAATVRLMLAAVLVLVLVLVAAVSILRSSSAPAADRTYCPSDHVWSTTWHDCP